jgi:hypothetical protein
MLINKVDTLTKMTSVILQHLLKMLLYMWTRFETFWRHSRHFSRGPGPGLQKEFRKSLETIPVRGLRIEKPGSYKETRILVRFYVKRNQWLWLWDGGDIEFKQNFVLLYTAANLLPL